MRRKRPTQRVHCLPGGFNANRPCMHLRCRWHVWNELGHGGSSAPLRVPEDDPSRLRHSCVLDLAETGGGMGSGRGPGLTLDQIGTVLGLTRERVRQIEAGAVGHIRESGVGLAALELMRLRSSGQLDGAAPHPVEPEGGPVITARERACCTLALQRLTHTRRCANPACKRPARPLYVYGDRREIVPDGYYCSYSCRRRHQAERGASLGGSA